MKQISSSCFVSEDGKMTFLFDSDTPAGCMHDFLMHVKGIIVEKMQENHLQESAIAEKLKSIKTVE